MPVAVEVCVDGVESALAAREGGANRVELCDNLLEGGTTPSYGVIAATRRRLHIGLHVIIRPRGGDFCYSAAEFEVMKRDIWACKDLGADAVVLGILSPSGTVDSDRVSELVALARPMAVTFHRAFDMTRDAIEALKALVTLNIERVLTSGQAPSALAGVPLLKRLVEASAGKIKIMAGGGVNLQNAQQIVQASGVSEIHVGSGCTVSLDSPMKFRNPALSMGTTESTEYTLRRTSAAAVRSLVNCVNARN